MRTLYGISQSPWSEKARWALDHHGVAIRYHEHVPLLGEVFLRRKTRGRPKGTKPSVPLLVDGDAVVQGSLAIARHAERVGRGDPLFPATGEAAIARWAEVSDRLIGAGRARVLAGLRSNADAQREALPSFIPGVLRGVLRPMAASAAHFLQSKYDVSADDDDAILGPALDEIRASLHDGYLVGHGFTFADLAVAASLQALRPRASSSIGPATRAVWSNAPLAERYQDLLVWRDAIYAKHRPSG